MNPQPVLYAEDEADDAFFMQRAFRQSGLRHPLLIVTDGQEAIDYFSGTGRFNDRSAYPLPSLVLLDLSMPKKSGFEVLPWIRNHPAFRDLPVIIYSSSAAQQDRERAAALGATDYWVKGSGYPAVLEAACKIRVMLNR